MKAHQNKNPISQWYASLDSFSDKRKSDAELQASQFKLTELLLEGGLSLEACTQEFEAFRKRAIKEKKGEIFLLQFIKARDSILTTLAEKKGVNYEKQAKNK